MKKFGGGGGGGLFDYSVTPGPGLSKNKLQMSGTNPVMPGQVKARAKELDNILHTLEDNTVQTLVIIISYKSWANSLVPDI